MNYEEMLNSREGVASYRETLPIGTFYKKLIDKKYRNVVELKPALADSIEFCEALKADISMTANLKHPAQLHFTAKEDSGGIYEIELEQGNYQTFGQLLSHNPAVVTGKGYVERVIGQLASILKCLHEQKVYQCCLSPNTIFARKSDNMPMLLCHGSFYKALTEKGVLTYDDYAGDVAPEVLSGGVVDKRSDVYALGKFIERLHADGSMPMEYKTVVAIATKADPQERFATISEMLEMVDKRRSMLHTAFMAAAAVVIALVCIFIYIGMMPETNEMEYVNPIKEEVPDPYDAGLTPMELGLDSNDSVYLSEEERVQMAAMEAKVEEIFRKQFKEETEKVFSKMYSKEHMSSTEQTFIQGNNTMMDDLLRKRDALAAQAGLTHDKAEDIAKQIMGEIQAEKKKQLKSYGYQRPEKSNE